MRNSFIRNIQTGIVYCPQTYYITTVDEVLSSVNQAFGLSNTITFLML